jgi:uncharacterized protein (DUF3820 family)
MPAPPDGSAEAPLLRTLPDENEPAAPATTVAEEETQETHAKWDWFEHISEYDLAYLSGPRQYPDPCPWCGLRLSHTAACQQLHDEWSMLMPFGKHKGTLVRRVPVSYLKWLSRRNVSGELREEIERVLRQRRHRNWATYGLSGPDDRG